MRWYTAIGMKKDDADGRFCVWVDGEEKVLTEMETILWAALTWSFCEEDKVHSQMHRLLVFSLGEKQAQEWADKEDFQFCLNRLVKRGLVVLTEGCTREEAVYSITTGTEPCSAYEIYCGICESITIARQEKTNERGLLALEEKIAGCVSKRWHEYDIPGTVKY